MSLSDLRKELKNLRKEAMPTPVSRMKKTEVAMELERLRGLSRGSKSVAAVEVPSAPAVVEKVAKKVVAEKKVEVPKVKAEKPKKEEAPKEEKYVPSKFVKGSQEAKDRMAAIRAKKGKKSDE
jgi:hypothetical protein